MVKRYRVLLFLSSRKTLASFRQSNAQGCSTFITTLREQIASQPLRAGILPAAPRYTFYRSRLVRAVEWEERKQQKKTQRFVVLRRWRRQRVIGWIVAVSPVFCCAHRTGVFRHDGEVMNELRFPYLGSVYFFNDQASVCNVNNTTKLVPVAYGAPGVSTNRFTTIHGH